MFARSLSTVMLFGLAAATQACAADPEALSADRYAWTNVAIGGGGYITGVEVHAVDPSVIYVRTDVGGFYRYDHDTAQLVQLMNWVPFERRNLYGIAGVALHPTDTNILYVAAGMYDRNEDPADHEVFISRDRGESFSPLGYPGRFGGNQTPDKYANMIAINPANPNALLVGSRGKGLWRYDGNGNWSAAEGIPATGTDKVGPILFDPADPRHVFVAVWNHGVFRSTTGGQSFDLIPGSSTTVHNLAISRTGQRLYAATQGDGFQRLDNPATSSNWLTRNTPSAGVYRGVAASPHADDTVITARSEYGGLSHVSISTDAGESWTRKQEHTVEQAIPWHPSQYPGSAIADFAWDPKDPARVYFTDWYSFWRTDDIFAPKVTWTNEMGHGHEELVALSLLAPPTNADGVLLYSGHADVSGMRHTDLTQYPQSNFRSGMSLSEVTSLALSPANPARLYLAGARGHSGTEGRFARSDDYGKTWTGLESYPAAWGWARIAVSATNPDNVVAVTRSAGVKYSTDAGQTWSDASGTPSSADLRVNTHVWTYAQPLTADAVNDHFYLFNPAGGAILRSSDAGATWQPVATGLPTPSGTHLWHLRSVPGHAGHLFASFLDKGLATSTDAGRTWTFLSGIREVRLLALGAPAPGSNYPTIYFMGRLNADDQQWFYASTDSGKTWSRINDERARIGGSPQMFTADQQTFGRVFVGTNGTGVWVGQLRDRD